MLKKLAKTVSAVVLALTVVGATQAAAKPKLHEAQFFGSPDNAPTVRVGAENGRWVLMKSPGITYRFSYYVKANRPLQMVMVGAGDFPAELMAPFVRGKISTGSNLQRTAWDKDPSLYRITRLGATEQRYWLHAMRFWTKANQPLLSTRPMRRCNWLPG